MPQLSQYGTSYLEGSWRALLFSLLWKIKWGSSVLTASPQPHVQSLLKPWHPLKTFSHVPLGLSHFGLSFLSLRNQADSNIHKAFSTVKIQWGLIISESSPRRITVELWSITKIKKIISHSGWLDIPCVGAKVWCTVMCVITGKMNPHNILPLPPKHYFLKIREVGGLSGLHLLWRVTWSCGLVHLSYTSAATTDGCPPAFIQGQQEAK